MKKEIIVILAAIGVIVGHMMFGPKDDAKETARPESSTSPPARAVAEPADEETIATEREGRSSKNLLPKKSANGTDRDQEVPVSPMADIAMQVSQMSWSARMKLFREDFIPNITRENWRETFDALNQFEPGSHEAHALRRCRPDAMNKIGEFAGREAMLHVYGLRRQDDIEACLKGWMMSEPDEAIEWLEREVGPSNRAAIWSAHAKGLQDDETRMARSMAKGFLATLVDRHGVEKAERIFQRMADDVKGSEGLDKAYIRDMFTVLANETVANMLAETDEGLDGSAEWLRGHLGQPYVTPAAVSRTLMLLTRQDGGEAAIGWMDESRGEHPDSDAALYDPIISEWSDMDGLETVGVWLNEQGDHPQYDRLAYAYAKKVMKVDPERAIMWAKSISDEELRARLLKEGEIYE